ncbi:MAG: YncE family protein [Rudaea sp.]
MDSASALTGGPFAYVPSNDTGTNTFSIVNLATKLKVGNDVVIDPPDHPQGTSSAFYGVAVSPKTGMLFISDDGRSEAVFQIDISKIGTATNPVVKYYNVGNNPHGMAVDPSGKHVYVAQFGVSNVSIIDTTANNDPNNHNAGISSVDFGKLSGSNGAQPFDVKLNLGGTVAYVSDASTNGRVCRFNAVAPPASVSDADCVAVGTAPNSGGENPNALAVSPDGTRVYVVNRNDNSISVLDTTQVDATTHNPILTIVRSFKLRFGGNVIAGPNGIAINPSGKRAYVGMSTGHILSVDLLLADKNPLQNPPEPVVLDLTNPAQISNVLGVAISPDAQRVVAADFDTGLLHFVNIVNDVDSYDGSVPVNAGPRAFGQFAGPDDRIFVSEIGSTAAGG